MSVLPKLLHGTYNTTQKAYGYLKKNSLIFYIVVSQIKRSRGAARSRLMMRAKNVMRKKKMLDQQYGVMLNQSFNMEQVSFTLSNAKDTVETVKAMKAATTELKRAFKEDINLDEIEVENIAQKFKSCIPHARICTRLCATFVSFLGLINFFVFRRICTKRWKTSCLTKKRYKK